MTPQEATERLHKDIQSAVDEETRYAPARGVVRDYIERGADINAVIDGMTPVLLCLSQPYLPDHSAPYKGRLEGVLDTLLDNNVDLSCKTPQGYGVLDLALAWQDGGKAFRRLEPLVTAAIAQTSANITQRRNADGGKFKFKP